MDHGALRLKIEKRAAEVMALAAEKEATLATAESCTGGLLAAALTEIPGASAIFERGYVSYSNRSKHFSLGVSEEMLGQHGAVSEPIARAMAEGARRKSKAMLAISVTGIAGPDGGSEKKPVGTVFIGLASRESSICHHYNFSGNRTEIRLQATSKALDLLYSQLSLISF